MRNIVDVPNYGDFFFAAAHTQDFQACHGLTAPITMEDNFVPCQEITDEENLDETGDFDSKSVWEMTLDFGTFKRKAELGRGRRGVIELFENEDTRERIAVRQMEVRDSSGIERIIHEIEILSNLIHPCLVKTIGWGLPSREKMRVEIGMEYMCHGSLEDVLQRVRKNDIPPFWSHLNISRNIVAITLGMKYLHSHSIVHGNLKPGNLLFDEEGRVRICDYCLSADWGDERTPNAYLAPEIVNGLPLTTMGDVFAFGLITWELLVTDCEMSSSLLSVVRDGTWPQIPAAIHPSVRDLIKQCLSLEPESRPTFADIWELFEEEWFPFFSDVSPILVLEFVSEMNCQILDLGSTYPRDRRPYFQFE
jgi:serine/threonine protein kinase